MWNYNLGLLSLFLFLIVPVHGQRVENGKRNGALINRLETSAKENLIDKWYPLVLDNEDGGYYSDITYDFKVGENQDKMIVTQARHLWATTKAAELYPEDSARYLSYATHGFQFLRDKMWDNEHGGFYNLVTKGGKAILKRGTEKTAYGNSFAIYGLAEYYRASGNEAALNLAKKTFKWLESHSHDTQYKGYYQSLELDGTPIQRTSELPSTSDIGYKDQNSSIHLLESFTTLYEIWPDELLANRIKELLYLIRDTIVTEKGYMNLFFTKDWKPVSFKNTSKENIVQHYYLDHVSFGHDVETAYLMLEASHVLGLKDEDITLQRGKKMVDHALRNGWDEKLGGFYDGGYYYLGEDNITIVNSDKNWWAQAEGLNSLLIMDRYFPDDTMNYRSHFEKLWNYTERYLMDPVFGGWYEWGIDERPESENQLKGHIWKASYHNFRALRNVISQLQPDKER